MKQQTNFKSAFVLITTLFFMWGFITVLVDALVPRLKDVFELSYGQSIMVQFAFFGAFFCFAIPSSILLEKIGYRMGIVVGLCTMGIACLLFYPAADIREFWIFITAFFTLATGITLLQVAANPYVTLLGDEKGASSRLNLSQAFNSFGTLLAPIAGAIFLLSDSVKNSDEIKALSMAAQETYLVSEALTVQQPFLVIAAILFLLAGVFAFVKLPALIQKAPKGGYAKLLSNKRFMMGVFGIFMYVGAEVSIGSFLVNYFSEMDLQSIIRNSDFLSGMSSTLLLGADITTMDDKAILGSFVTLFWGGAMIGRFVGAYLMKSIKSSMLLMVFAGLAVVSIAISVSTTGVIAMWSILAVGLFNSIMFPTIFSLALDGLDNLKAQGSGLLVMGIVGGAIIPKLTGVIADASGLKTALLLLIVCYAYIAFFGKFKTATEPAPK